MEYVVHKLTILFARYMPKIYDKALPKKSNNSMIIL